MDDKTIRRIALETAVATAAALGHDPTEAAKAAEAALDGLADERGAALRAWYADWLDDARRGGP